MSKEESSGTTLHAYNVRAADAKEVGVGNPAEETYCHPDECTLFQPTAVCQLVIGAIAATDSHSQWA
jgi:hypothetical protein